MILLGFPAVARYDGAMLGKSVLIYSGDRNESRRVAACLRAAGNEVVCVGHPDAAVDLMQAQAVDLVLVDDHSADTGRVIAAAEGRQPVVVLSSQQDGAVLLDLVCERKVDNLFVRRAGPDSTANPEGDGLGLGTLDTREVVVTVEKILRRQLFGLDKYLPSFGFDTSRYQLHRADERGSVIDSMQAYLRLLGGGRLAGAMGLVADELMTNAIYNAPRDERGLPRYESTDRREKIVLAPWETVTVEYGSDGHTFGVSVSDRFGALTGDKLRSCLRRCLTSGDQIEQKAGGAGLGLYTVLSSCSQLVINVEPGERTEIIALVDLERRMRGMRGGGHSLQMFTTPRPEAAPEVIADNTVALSDSMRFDLRESAAAGASPPVIPLVKRKGLENVRRSA